MTLSLPHHLVRNSKSQILVSPANLVFGDYAMNYVMQFDETSSKTDLRGRWRQRQQIYSSFESLWHSSYMDYIGKRSKWTEYRNSLKAGDIVLIKSPAPTKKRNYPLGLIVEMRTSPDGFSRQALIRRANYQSLNKQILDRKQNWRKFYGFTKEKPLESIPIQRLYPLEGGNPIQEDIIESALTQTWYGIELGKQVIQNFHYTLDIENPNCTECFADFVDIQQL